jgi:hypothetical protein
MGWSINLSQEPSKIDQDAIGSTVTTVHGVQQTCTYLITQNKASREHNIYKHMQDTKPHTCKGASNF